MWEKKSSSVPLGPERVEAEPFGSGSNLCAFLRVPPPSRVFLKEPLNPPIKYRVSRYRKWYRKRDRVILRNVPVI